VSARFDRRYIPKARIRRKVEKPSYRRRYERRVEGRALFNSHGLLCGVAARLGE
jgi:hypothetical protein